MLIKAVRVQKGALFLEAVKCLYFIDHENAIEAYRSKRKSKLGEQKKTRRSYLIQRTSVADPGPQGSTFISVSWIQIRFRIGNMDPDPDPGGPKKF